MGSKKTGAAKGPDNNQRLAFLEAEAGILGNFFAVSIEGLDPIEGESASALAMRAFNHVEARRAGLSGQIEELGRVLLARPGFAPAADESAAAAAIRVIGELSSDNARLSASLRGFKASATRARGEVQVLKAEKSPEARPIGALPASASDGERLRTKLLFEAALRDGPTTLVFSDGKREIRELEPLIVDGGAWRSSARGHVLNHQPLLEPGDMIKPVVRIVGFGLLDEAGEQVGWQQLVEPIDVPRNGRVQLPAGTIRFAF